MDEEGFGDSNSCQKKRVSYHYLEVERAKDNDIYCDKRIHLQYNASKENTEQLDHRVPPIHELQARFPTHVQVTDISEIGFATTATISIQARCTPGMQQNKMKTASQGEANPS